MALIGETYLECQPEDYNESEAEEVPVLMGYKKNLNENGSIIPPKSLMELLEERYQRFKSNPLYNVFVGIIIAILLIKLSKYAWDLRNNFD